MPQAPSLTIATGGSGNVFVGRTWATPWENGNLAFLVNDVLEADRDGDGLGDELEVSLGTDPDRRDTDGDGIGDGYEMLGRGRYLQFGWYGANPLHRDMFVQMDYVDTIVNKMTPEIARMIGDAFADSESTLVNPDGTRGIAIHIDMGPGCDQINATAPASFGPIVGCWEDGGATYPEQPNGSSVCYNRDWHMPAERRPYFRYHYKYGGGSGRTTLGFPISSSGDNNGPGYWAETFVHETGHEFGLPDMPWPGMRFNYPSVMSYTYQSRRRFSSGSLPTVVPAKIDEILPSPIPPALRDVAASYYFGFTIVDGPVTTLVDFSRNGVPGERGVRAAFLNGDSWVLRNRASPLCVDGSCNDGVREFCGQDFTNLPTTVGAPQPVSIDTDLLVFYLVPGGEIRYQRARDIDKTCGDPESVSPCVTWSGELKTGRTAMAAPAATRIGGNEILVVYKASDKALVSAVVTVEPDSIRWEETPQPIDCPEVVRDVRPAVANIEEYGLDYDALVVFNATDAHDETYLYQSFFRRSDSTWTTPVRAMSTVGAVDLQPGTAPAIAMADGEIHLVVGLESDDLLLSILDYVPGIGMWSNHPIGYYRSRPRLVRDSAPAVMFFDGQWYVYAVSVLDNQGTVDVLVAKTQYSISAGQTMLADWHDFDLRDSWCGSDMVYELSGVPAYGVGAVEFGGRGWMFSDARPGTVSGGCPCPSNWYPGRILYFPTASGVDERTYADSNDWLAFSQIVPVPARGCDETAPFGAPW